jgi:hypothetical protein
MSVSILIKSAGVDTVGQETVLRVVGTREPPAKMVIQIAITGTANAQLQGRIARDAPWVDLDQAHAKSALVHIDAVQFLRVVTTGVASGASVSAWAVWGW